MKTVKRNSALALVAALLIPAVMLISCIDFPQDLAGLDSSGEQTESYAPRNNTPDGFNATYTGTDYEPEGVTLGYLQLNVGIDSSLTRTIVPNTG